MRTFKQSEGLLGVLSGVGTGNEHNFIKVKPECLFDSMQTVEHLRIGLGSRIIINNPHSNFQISS